MARQRSKQASRRELLTGWATGAAALGLPLVEVGAADGEVPGRKLKVLVAGAHPDDPAHSGDLWEFHRSSGAGRLVRLLEVIYRYGVEPISGFGVQLEPRVGFNFGPPPS